MAPERRCSRNASATRSAVLTRSIDNDIAVSVFPLLSEGSTRE